MTPLRRRLSLAGPGLAGALLVAILAGAGVAPARAQEPASPGPAAPGTSAIADKDGYCLTCGNKIGDAKVCSFCGSGGNSYPQRKGATPPAAPATPAPAPRDDAIPPTEKVPPTAPQAPQLPAPQQPAPGATKPEEMPRVTAPGEPGPDKPAEGADGSDARSRAYRDDNMAKGDYYFKTGYYLKASEAYRVAVLAEPTNPWKKLAFGHALFAIGNYSYASYALRRASTQLDGGQAFQPDVASLFPSKRAFEKAVKDLKRYVTYSPRDPAGLSVLGYMLFSQGEDDRAREMFVYLQRLPKNDQDPFAAFFLKQISARAGKGEPRAAVPELTDPKEAKPVEPPKPAPAPAPKPVAVTPPEAGRQDEEPAKVKPAKGSALSE